MLVPRSRLLLWVALVAVPALTVVPLAREWMGPALAVLAALVLVVSADAARAGRDARGLTVEAPAVTRLSKDRPGAIEIRLHHDPPRARQLRLGLAWPRELESPQPEILALLPAGTPHGLVSWPCVPRERGQFHLSRLWIETISPLGFWATRTTRSLDAEVRVYPNLGPERRSLAALFLNRGALGLHVQRQVGKGREFEKLREYIPGDPSEDISWKATAKRGHPVTKVFQIERTQEVYVIIDASRLSGRMIRLSGEEEAGGRGPARTEAPLARGRPRDSAADESSAFSGVPRLTPAALDPAASASTSAPGETTVLERFVTAALVVGLAAQRQGDLFGLAAFSDQVRTFLRAKNGREHHLACREAIHALQPQRVAPDFEALSSFLRTRLRRRALLLFLTALDDPVLAEQFLRGMDLLARQHLVLVNMLEPAGVRPLFAAPDVESLDDLYERFGGHLQWRKLREVGATLQRHGVAFTLLHNDRLSAQLISQYLAVKQRQLL